MQKNGFNIRFKDFLYIKNEIDSDLVCQFQLLRI